MITAARKPDEKPTPPAQAPAPKADPKAKPEAEDEEADLIRRLDEVRRRRLEENAKKAEAASGEIAKALEKVQAPQDGRWWLVRQAGAWQVHAATGAAARAPRAANGNASVGGRDPRLPAPGTTIDKPWRGRVLRITFGEGSEVECDGTRYSTVSALAKGLTGQSTNGYVFLGLAAK